MNNNIKPVSSNIISDSDYIKELESVVCFLAKCYEKAKNTYFDTHLETCSLSNPNRRDLSESEMSEWQRFPLIQGSRLQDMVSDFAKSEKPNPNNIHGMFERFMKNDSINDLEHFSLEEMKETIRNEQKRLFIALNYSDTINDLARNMGISTRTAYRLLNKYNVNYSLDKKESQKNRLLLALSYSDNIDELALNLGVSLRSAYRLLAKHNLNFKTDKNENKSDF